MEEQAKLMITIPIAEYDQLTAITRQFNELLQSTVDRITASKEGYIKNLEYKNRTLSQKATRLRGNEQDLFEATKAAFSSGFNHAACWYVEVDKRVSKTKEEEECKKEFELFYMNYTKEMR